MISLGATPVAVLGWAMIPDTVEYAQWKHGVRADGAIYSVASFCQKLAKTVGGAGVALFLGLAGYVADQAQTTTSLAAIHACMTLLPALIMLILVGLTYIHRLDQAAHAKIVDELRGVQT